MRAVTEAMRATGRRETAAAEAAAEAKEQRRREELAIDADDGPAAAAVLPLAIVLRIRVERTKGVPEAFCARGKGPNARLFAFFLYAREKGKALSGVSESPENLLSQPLLDQPLLDSFSRRSLSRLLARLLCKQWGTTLLLKK